MLKLSKVFDDQAVMNAAAEEISPARFGLEIQLALKGIDEQKDLIPLYERIIDRLSAKGYKPEIITGSVRLQNDAPEKGGLWSKHPAFLGGKDMSYSSIYILCRKNKTTGEKSDAAFRKLVSAAIEEQPPKAWGISATQFVHESPHWLNKAGRKIKGFIPG
ncbi:MAG: hypothetical protein H6867_06665 [Rhodospirillales bacterium]|nr:hypothetical protein [Rhodospirillales bacterium]MCB9995231.1 hypothetical protein [Rhodospirillales bacterium]